MSMSKRDYVALAQVIAQTTPAPRDSPTPYDLTWASGCDSARRRIAEHFADYCERTYPQFDRDKFIAACA
jgi:hypothetical protein